MRSVVVRPAALGGLSLVDFLLDRSRHLGRQAESSGGRLTDEPHQTGCITAQRIAKEAPKDRLGKCQAPAAQLLSTHVLEARMRGRQLDGIGIHVRRIVPRLVACLQVGMQGPIRMRRARATTDDAELASAIFHRHLFAHEKALAHAFIHALDQLRQAPTRLELRSSEHRHLEGVGELRLDRARVLRLALSGLKVRQVGLAGQLALEDALMIVAQPRGIRLVFLKHLARRCEKKHGTVLFPLHVR